MYGGRILPAAGIGLLTQIKATPKKLWMITGDWFDKGLGVQ
jgi:hypothetical protein